MWKKYYGLEAIRRLRNSGRELVGKYVILTEKRDGENVSLWIDCDSKLRISSHNQENAGQDIVNRMKETKELSKAESLLRDELKYNGRYILYGELIKKGRSPTGIEPLHKLSRWVLFDIYDAVLERYLGYNAVYQKAYHYKIPVVRLVDHFIPESMDDLDDKIKDAMKWCKRHRREGVVGKDFKQQIFFKEKVDLPKLKRIKKPKDNEIQLPEMPDETILRSLQHAFDEVGEDNWNNVKIAMPVIAKHFQVEAKEHNYNPPRNMYWLYMNTPLDKVKGNSNVL